MSQGPNIFSLNPGNDSAAKANFLWLLYWGCGRYSLCIGRCGLKTLKWFSLKLGIDFNHFGSDFTEMDTDSRNQV